MKVRVWAIGYLKTGFVALAQRTKCFSSSKLWVEPLWSFLSGMCVRICYVYLCGMYNSVVVSGCCGIYMHSIDGDRVCTFVLGCVLVGCVGKGVGCVWMFVWYIWGLYVLVTCVRMLLCEFMVCIYGFVWYTCVVYTCNMSICICGACVIYLSICYLCSVICIACVYNELYGLHVAWCVSVVCDMRCIVLGIHMCYVW